MGKRNLISFLREIIIVIMGILIALSINTWNENRKDKAYINKALAAIHKEIKLNKTKLAPVIEKHARIRDSIQTHLKDESFSISQILSDAGGLQIANASNIALRYFVPQKTELIDFEIIIKLAQIEYHDKLVAYKMNKLVDHIYDHSESSLESDKLKSLIYIAEVLESEQGLMALYDDFLKGDKGSEDN